MITQSKLSTFAKWLALGLFTFFLAANTVFAFKGMVSVLFFSVIFTLAFLLSESVLKITGTSNRIRGNTRIVIISIFTSILIGEVFFRISGKYDSYGEKNGHFFYRLVYDEAGYDTKLLFEFYNRAYKTANQTSLDDIDSISDDHFRILGLGDSFTEGVGAPEDSTWLKILETNLNERPGTRKIKTINAGISGNDPFFEYFILKEKLLAHKPDLVIVAINSSDIAETITRGGMERFRTDSTIAYRQGPWFEIIFGMSYVCRAFVFEVLNYDWLLLTKEEREREETEALDKIQSCILNFGQLAKDNSLEILLLFHPMVEEVISGSSPFDRMIQELSDNPQLKIFDLLKYYRAEGEMNKGNAMDYYWEIDRHHNAKGYALFAKGVEKKIIEKLERIQ